MSHLRGGACPRDMRSTFPVAVGCGAPDDASVDPLVVADGGTAGGMGGGMGGGGGGAASGCPSPKPALDCQPLNQPTICMNGMWTCPPTPLVLAYDREEVLFSPADGTRFDLMGTGDAVSTDWPTAQTPWLALDRNRNGVIDDATELFGSAVRLADGRLAINGFEALAELDENRDGQVDARDARFGDLSVWSDRDGDRATGPGELQPAFEGPRALVAIGRRGNCGVDGRGQQHRGEVVDVHLPGR